MTKEEMKLVKFETMINDLYSKGFFPTVNFEDEKGNDINPVVILLGQESINPYIEIISRITMPGMCKRKRDVDIKKLILEARTCIECGWQCCNLAAQLLFVSLLCLAIDNELYNEKLEIVSDVAYLIGFNEQMIEDWIAAVKKFLLAEKICYKEMKTEQARRFFKEFEERWESA